MLPIPLNVRIAISSALWSGPHGDDLIPWLEQVRDSGYGGVTGFAEWGWQDYLDEPKDFGRKVADHGLAVASVICGVHTDFDQYRRVCDFMAALECRHLVLIGGNGKEDNDFAAIGALLNHIGSIALERGSRASYHHHSQTIGETFEDMDRLLLHSDPERLFAMCDTGHATRDFVRQPIEERAALFLRKYWNRLDLVEFKDWNHETDLNTPLGEGLCPFESVFALLREKSYSGWIVVEQNGADGPSRGRQPLECARISREFIRRHLLEAGSSLRA